MEDLIVIILAYAADFGLFYFFVRNAQKHGIHLSKLTKILFLVGFTSPLVIIWYVIVRIAKRRRRDEPTSATDSGPTQTG